MGEVLLVHAVHLREVVHRRQENGHLHTVVFASVTRYLNPPGICGDESSIMRTAGGVPHLDDPTNRTPRALENILDALARRRRLIGDTALDQFPRRIGRDLARDENLRPGRSNHRLALHCQKGRHCSTRAIFFLARAKVQAYVWSHG